MTSCVSFNFKKPPVYGFPSHESRKKVKHFSYSPTDKVGKGFSSIVYKGTNDLTSKSESYSDQVVAIKAIDMKGVKDAISREMLDC